VIGYSCLKLYTVKLIIKNKREIRVAKNGVAAEKEE
jgi:hypothetical protein